MTKSIILAAVASVAIASTASTAPAKFRRLPLGSVKARSFLLAQLELQRDGLTGHAEELYEDIGKSDWLTGEKRGKQFAWERGPYWLKGLVALAGALHDPALKARAAKWIDAILASQRPDGDFGPKDRNWWANMIVLHLLRDWHDLTADSRIIPFLERYFDFQSATLPSRNLRSDSCWAMARGGDELEIVLWLHDLTGKSKFLDLARLVASQTGKWDEFYTNSSNPGFAAQSFFYPAHIVNYMQGLKSIPLRSRLGDAERLKHVYLAATESGPLAQRFRRPDGMLSGSEPLSDSRASAGTELCAIAERILSSITALEVFGEAYLGDQLERVAYNALPATLAPDGKGIRYYSMPNQPRSSKVDLGFAQNGFNWDRALCPGPDAGYGCCRSNFHFAWPKFVSGMWMMRNGGLAACAYGPNEVSATIAGKTVSILQETSYPFSDRITFTVSGEGDFPLALRIPRWCSTPSILVNGAPAPVTAAPGSFAEIRRSWTRGDKIVLSLPSKARAVRWPAGVAVEKGALAYSLPLAADRKQLSSRKAGNVEFPTWALEPKPGERWNFGLALSSGELQIVKEEHPEILPRQPFSPETPPASITVQAFTCTDPFWGGMDFCWNGIPAEPPPSPVPNPSTPQTLTLIPYGSTQLRITIFPHN